MALLLTVHVALTAALLLVFLLVVAVQWVVRRPWAAVAEVVRAPLPRVEEAGAEAA